MRDSAGSKSGDVCVLFVGLLGSTREEDVLHPGVSRFHLGETLYFTFYPELELTVVQTSFQDDLVDLVLVIDVVSQDLLEPFDREVVVLPEPVLDLL